MWIKVGGGWRVESDGSDLGESEVTACESNWFAGEVLVEFMYICKVLGDERSGLRHGRY
jgi:hypothetical protein